MNIQLNDPKEKLWNSLFAEKQFYAREFLRDYPLYGTIIDFYCPEAKFALCISSNASSNIVSPGTKKEYAASGIHLTIVDEWELESEYQRTVDFITKEFTGLLRFQCS